jgi:hypothetical protein
MKSDYFVSTPEGCSILVPSVGGQVLGSSFSVEELELGYCAKSGQMALKTSKKQQDWTSSVAFVVVSGFETIR